MCSRCAGLDGAASRSSRCLRVTGCVAGERSSDDPPVPFEAAEQGDEADEAFGGTNPRAASGARPEVPPNARAVSIGRGHRFAAYPQCSADVLERMAADVTSGMTGGVMACVFVVAGIARAQVGEPAKWRWLEQC